ncbi:unnamed protein product [Brachionus calyciflorus]|uniref:Uncharacterized protein n=1 Tax=Brachionus calyciflorus TaxID=104777 RepID=A0A814CX87_9BILA|nr:unnamed protein product [Brachionus calyciflorus]
MAQKFMNKREIFFRSLTQETLLEATKEIAQMGRDNFTERISKRVSNDDKNSKKELNKLRITFGKFVLQQLGITNDLKFVNRNRARTMGYDLWNLIISIEEKKLVNEANEMFKNNGKNDTINNTQMENEQNDAKHDMNSLFERLFSEMEDLKNSNKEILDKVKILKEENASLKNMV